MSDIITEAQRILDHPDELVSGREYRRIIDGLMELCRQSPDAWETGALGRDERYVRVVPEADINKRLPWYMKPGTADMVLIAGAGMFMASAAFFLIAICSRLLNA